MTNFLFKNLKIDNYNIIEKEIKKYIINNYSTLSTPFVKININKLFYNCINLHNWIKQYHLNCAVAAVISIPSKKNGIHTDQNKNRYAINFGIQNYLNSPTILYKLKKLSEEKLKLSENVFYNKINDSDVEEIDRFYLTTPVMFDTLIPHSIVHNENNIRISLSLRFENDISLIF